MTSSLVQVPQMTPVKESTNGRDTSAAPPDEATASKQHTPAKRARTSMPDCGSSSGGARADNCDQIQQGQLPRNVWWSAVVARSPFCRRTMVSIDLTHVCWSKIAGSPNL